MVLRKIAEDKEDYNLHIKFTTNDFVRMLDTILWYSQI